ncbi:fibroblast growth factor 21 [Rhinichthys klamathensis goyatoka]|uniref:fibroblast growth factor 21 n=1 Tax=Rhinichthys klamathensis goyatoka TaxID=3034132 RepID=UPI0024B56710|nr:fibroblast growth factor 21 [Rhinichthys klamathensis goyatoka]
MPTWSAWSIMLFAVFFIFFTLFPTLHWCIYIPEQNVLLAFSTQVRKRLLYTENRFHGLFLEMNPDGSVRGSPEQRQNCVLKLRSVKAGETVIQSAATSLYLCVDDEDNLKGQPLYSKGDCIFQELLLEDGYSSFLSPHTRLPVSLPSKQSGQKHGAPLSRFLPIMNTVAEDSQIQEVKQYIQDLNLEYDDPLGMRHRSHTLSSPSLHTKK